EGAVADFLSRDCNPKVRPRGCDHRKEQDTPLAQQKSNTSHHRSLTHRAYFLPAAGLHTETYEWRGRIRKGLWRGKVPSRWECRARRFGWFACRPRRRIA